MAGLPVEECKHMPRLASCTLVHQSVHCAHTHFIILTHLRWLLSLVFASALVSFCLSLLALPDFDLRLQAPHLTHAIHMNLLNIW